MNAIDINNVKGAAKYVRFNKGVNDADKLFEKVLDVLYVPRDEREVAKAICEAVAAMPIKQFADGEHYFLDIEEIAIHCGNVTTIENYCLRPLDWVADPTESDDDDIIL